MIVMCQSLYKFMQRYSSRLHCKTAKHVELVGYELLPIAFMVSAACIAVVTGHQSSAII